MIRAEYLIQHDLLTAERLAFIVGAVAVGAVLMTAPLFFWLGRRLERAEADADAAEERADMAEKPLPLFAERFVPRKRRRPRNPLLTWAADVFTAERRAQSHALHDAGDLLQAATNNDEQVRLAVAYEGERTS